MKPKLNKKVCLIKIETMLFVAFAPYKNPQYAISVLVEHGGSGGKAAAPIAKKVIKKVLERHELRRSVNNQIGESV